MPVAVNLSPTCKACTKRVINQLSAAEDKPCHPATMHEMKITLQRSKH